MVSPAINASPPSAVAKSRTAIDLALAAYQPITLAEMDGVRLMNRVDTKYVIHVATLAELLAAITDDYRVLEEAGVRVTPYSTLYFDTRARDCYREHHNGHADRRKFRMRSYNSGTTFFEIKTKTNKGRTVKKRLPISRIRPTIDGEAAGLVEEVTGRQIDLSPQMWTNFSRITLVGREAAERVTIDLELQFSDSQERQTGIPTLAIVEIKQERDSRNSSIRQRLKESHIAPLRISKYCIGSALLDPALKSNRFKAKLRALEALS